jgi:hypothetical protein
MGRTIIVGDVHGCREELELLLDDVGFASGDRLVFVGDLVARGPDSRGVLDIARQTGALIVRGNHEQKLLEWRDAKLTRLRGAAAKPVLLGRLHLAIAESLRPVDWTLLETSPLFLDLPEHAAQVVHAGVHPGIPASATRAETLLHIRTFHAGGHASSRSDGPLWGASYVGPPHIVFGHNAAPGLQLHRWATGLDTGCVYGRRLTALVLREGERVPDGLRARRARLVFRAAARVHLDPARSARGVA